MDYYDYFPSKGHVDGEVSMDEFIAESMRMDLRFQTPEEELQYLRTARTTLRNELLTCYEYLKAHGFLELYSQYRDGDECPF